MPAMPANEFARQLSSLRPPAAGRHEASAFEHTRDLLAGDVGAHWSGALDRLDGAAFDLICLAELWTWLVALAESYTREALVALSEDWRATAVARALLYGEAALLLREIIARREAGARAAA
jgi:hypothetical protein